MIFRQLDLTTALRPLLLPEEVLLFVQDAVGLYRDKYKIEGHQKGHAYLTSHRICYVDDDQPRSNSLAIDLKDVDRQELYARFLKSSPKITIYPKVTKRQSLAIRDTGTRSYNGSALNSIASSPTRAGFVSASSSPSPAPRDTSATWICPICSFSNPVPSNFDPGLVNANTPLPPCLACGIKPPLVHVTKAAIAAMSNRSARDTSRPPSHPRSESASGQEPASPTQPSTYVECPRCTFRNHPSIQSCEICGGPLPTPRNRHLDQIHSPPRAESPAPFTSATTPSTDPSMEVIKLSFRAGGEKTFHERLKDALIQRKWLLQSAPPVPRPNDGGTPSASPVPVRKAIGIAGLESRDRQLRKENELVMGNAFSDLEALMTSAKEVIALAERFATSNSDPSTQSTTQQAVSALGLTTTRDMLSLNANAEKTYIAQLARDLAEYLTDDARGPLRREGGIMTLVDLWSAFNRRRGGIELVAPRDLEAAAQMFDALALPVRLRRFRSGLKVVCGTDRTDERVARALLDWLRGMRAAAAAADPAIDGQGVDAARYGRGVSALETAARFGWSVGVAGEELGLAEDRGVLVREQDVRGCVFWENHFPDVALEEGTGGETKGFDGWGVA